MTYLIIQSRFYSNLPLFLSFSSRSFSGSVTGAAAVSEGAASECEGAASERYACLGSISMYSENIQMTKKELNFRQARLTYFTYSLSYLVVYLLTCLITC